MTREAIIQMAREAGFYFSDGIEFTRDAGFSIEDGIVMGGLADVERLIAKVAAAEREACAKLCDEMREHYDDVKTTALLNGDVELSNAASGEPRACEFLASSIRARSQS